MPPYDATAVERLDKAGAVFLGKTNCDEFAMGGSNENSAYGPVRNPIALDRVPGGSSGGSAAAVSAGLAVAALGTDTGGSIRQPGSFCGIPGMMPTYGRVSRYGLIAFASSLDKIGPFAGNVADAATVLSVIAGHDENDSTSAPVPVPDYTVEIDKPIQGLRIGVPEDYFGAGLDPEVKEKVQVGIALLERLGCRRVPLRMPHTDYAIATYYILATAEASSNLARFDGVRYGLRVPGATLTEMYRQTRERGFGPEVKCRIMLGTYALSAGYYDAYYLRAQKCPYADRARFRGRFSEGGCHHHSHGAHHRVPPWREDRRPASDVPGGHLYRYRVARRSPRHLRALRADHDRTSRRNADLRTALQGGVCPSNRARLRTGWRFLALSNALFLSYHQDSPTRNKYEIP